MPPMQRYLTSRNSSTPYFEPGRRCPSYSRRSVSGTRLERLEVVRQRLLEGGPRLAALLISLQRRSPGHDVGMAQNAENSGHQQIPRRKPAFEIVAAVEPILECSKPLLYHLHHHRPARMRPRLA